MSRGEQSMVPEPTFESYYGRPILKEPTWKTPDVPLYLFLGGLAGASALLAEGAALTGRHDLEKVARLAAAGGATAGTVALIHDLGRPERFLNMLRVLKPTSPLSVGSFILAPFSAFSGAAAAARVTGRLPRLGRLAGLGAAAFGPPLATYTAALVSNTAVPAWHEAHRELPFIFAGSGAQAAGGLAMVFVDRDQAAPARRMALAGAVVEIVAAEAVLKKGLVTEPYRTGRPGTLMRISRNATAVASAITLLGRGRSRLLSAVAGLTYVGRLDVMTTGLLLLTTDGEAVHRLTHPRYRVPRRYTALVHGRPAAEVEAAVKQRVVLDGQPVRPTEVRVRPGKDGRCILDVTLTEGRNRVVRRWCEALGLKVDRLARLSYGPVRLGDLPVGRSRPLTPREEKALYGLIRLDPSGA